MNHLLSRILNATAHIRPILYQNTIPCRILPHSTIHDLDLYSSNTKPLVVSSLYHNLITLCLSFAQQIFIETQEFIYEFLGTKTWFLPS